MATPDAPIKYRHPLYSKVWMFKRDRSPYWWTGFHHNGTYHRTSTKTKFQAEAEEFAAEWYFNQQLQIRNGKTPVKTTTKNLRTVKDASTHAISDYRVLVDRGDKSADYLRGIIRVLNKHILPHFGDMAVETIESVTWKTFHKQLLKKGLANNTIHQIRNALSLCMNAAAEQGWIKEAPRFKLPSQTNKPTKRVWFEPGEEQERLLAALDEYVAEMAASPHKKDSQELRDYAQFIMFSGLRVGEASALRFCDIREFTEDNGIPHIIISVNMGKRGIGTCNPDRKIMGVYRSIKERRQPKDKTETLFKCHHRDAFNKVLDNAGLKKDLSGKKRDFVSLRHTYICNKILERVPVYEIAHNCRTSPAMINKHYAWHLSPRLFKSLHKKDDAIINGKIAEIVQAEDDVKKLRKHKKEKLNQLVEMTKETYLTTEEIESIENNISMSPMTGDKQVEIIRKIVELGKSFGLTYDEVKKIVK